VHADEGRRAGNPDRHQARPRRGRRPLGDIGRAAARAAGRDRPAAAARRACDRGPSQPAWPGLGQALPGGQAGGPVVNAPVSADSLRQSMAGFRSDREADWKAFEALLARAEARSPKALTEEELLSLPILYRSALSSLSVARATSLDNALIAYL